MVTNWTGITRRALSVQEAFMESDTATFIRSSRPTLDIIRETARTPDIWRVDFDSFSRVMGESPYPMSNLAGESRKVIPASYKDREPNLDACGADW